MTDKMGRDEPTSDYIDDDLDDDLRAESNQDQEERAAILEFEAGMSREDADREAGL